MHDRLQKWTKACDKRLSRLISYIHYTSEYKQYCHVGNTGKQCRLGLFQDSDFAGDLEGSKSTSGGTLCVFGSHTFVPISWMCKKQTSFFAQINRIRNHFFGCRIEIGCFARSGIVGSDRYSSWEHVSEPHRTRRLVEEQNVKFVLHLTRFTNASNLRE